MATHEPEALLAIAQARISWVLDHPNMSEWLKRALRSAALQNDVEMLRQLIVPRTQAQIEIAITSASAA